MDIRCPHCQTLYDFDNARLRGGPVNLKCSQCSHIFRVEVPKTQQQVTQKRWMIRSADSDDIRYVDDMTLLQKWIIDRKVSRDDEISKTGKTWKQLGSIRELASLFEVADNIQQAQPRQPDPDPAPRDATPPPRADFFDPDAPGRPVIETPEHPPQEEDHDTSEHLDDEPHKLAPEVDIHTDAPPEPSLTGAIHAELPDEQGPAIETGAFQTIGTLDDPLDGPAETQRSNLLLPIGVVVCVLLAVGAVLLMSGDTSQTSTPDPATSTAPATNNAAAKDPADNKADKTTTAGEADKAPAKDSAAGDKTTDKTGSDKSAGKAAPAVTGDKVAAADTSAEDGTRDKANDDKTAAPEDAAPVDRAAFEAFLKQGYEHRSNGQPKDALEAFKAAARTDPTNAEAAAGVGWCYLGLSNIEQATQAFRTATRLNPKYADAFFGLGHSLRSAGKKEEAAVAYRTFIKLKPNDKKAINARKLLLKLSR